MGPRVADCPFPADAALEPRFVDRAFYREAYRVDLGRTALGPCDIFLAIFAHHPAWMNAAIRARLWLGARVGLQGSSGADGATIGRWPIHALDAHEVVAGRDDRHLDFRVVVRRDLAATPPAATVATVCVVHNWFGKLYLTAILPLHRWGVRLLIARALAAGRL